MNEKWLKYIVVLLSSGVLILGTLALTMDRARPASTDPPETGAETEESRTLEPDPSSDATELDATESETESETGTETVTETETETEKATETPTEAPTESETERESYGVVSIYDVAFIGDSRTVLMGSTETNGLRGTGILPDSALYAKYGGTLTDADVLDRARGAAEAGKKKAVFWLGVNDAQVNPERDSALTFLANYQNLIAEYLKINRESELYILSVVTTSPEEKDYYEDQDKNIEAYNRELKAFSERMGYTFIDLAPVFMGEASFLPDHIHFTDAYYAALIPYLEATVGFAR